MNKNSKLLKIIQWFFEEDKNADPVNDDDNIDLGPVQISLIMIFTAMLLAWIFYQPIIGFFHKPVPQAREYIAAHIEKNYFNRNQNLKNADFSQGSQHWATSDGGTLFPESKSIATVETNDYHSAPSCLKIKCLAPANRYHYSKKANDLLINNAYSYKETNCWLGVLPGTSLKAGLWYKGDIIKFAINYLKSDGEWTNLASVSGAAANKWSRLEIKEKTPEDARAIMLEITLNQAQGMPLPVVWVDDVNLTIDDSGAKNE